MQTEPTVNIQIALDPGATLPTKAHPSDIGYDVKALSVSVYPKDPVEHCLKQAIAFAATNQTQYLPRKILIDTGIHVRPAPGYYCELVPNSRLAKTPFSYGNSIGIIDPNYTGSIKVLLNVDPTCTIAELESIKKGTVVGQLIIRPQLHANFTQVDNLPETDRGTGGFGSTAKN